MKRMFSFFPISPLFAPDDGAGGGAPAAAAAAGAGGAAAGAASTPGASPAAGAAAAAPARDDAAAAAAAAGAGAADYWPEGFDPALKGPDGKTTMDNVAKRFGEMDKALKGYREADSRRDVVKTVEEMLDFSKAPGLKIDPKNQPYFDALTSDPVFKKVAEGAIASGIGRAAMGGLYQNFLNAASEAGLLEPMLDVKAERAALLPETAKALSPAEQNTAIDRRMQENFDFLTLASKNMGLPEEAGKYAELMLGDSAKGHVFLEWLKGVAQKGGGTGQPGAHGQGSGTPHTKESLRAAQAALKSNDPQFKQKQAEIDAAYKALYGD